MKVPFCVPEVGSQEAGAVYNVVTSKNLAAGKLTAEFEKKFAEYVGVKYAIFTNSGTAALKMAYKYFKEKGFTHYISPKNTFCATYAAAEEMGLVGWGDRGCFSPNTVEVNVHYGGVKDETPCLIEDSAHRIEKDDPMIGKIRIYSFYATKNMTTGSGGMFVTDDEAIYNRARLYWKDGLTTSSQDRMLGISDYEVECMAGGYDGNDIAAAIGLVQLQRLPKFTGARNKIVELYNKAFGQDWTGNHIYPYFVESEEEVKSLRNFLWDRGIHSGYHYPGNNWLGVSLPLYPSLTMDQFEHIVSTVREWEGK